MARRLSWLAFSLVAPRYCTGDVYHYDLNLEAYGSESNLRYRQSGMFSPKDAPSKTPPGNGHSFIDFGNLEFEVAPGAISMAYPGAVTFVEVAVFESRYFSELGVSVPGATVKQYCCTPWVQNRTGCHPSRGLIRSNPDSSPNSTIEIIRVPVPLVPGARVKLKKAGFEQLGHAGYSKAKIRKSGLYTLLLANCDATNALAILVTGETHWLNPYGWLPGELYGMMPFFGVMACLYAVVAFVWAILSTLNWSELTKVQGWITVVLGLGLGENVLKFADYLAWNASGERDSAALAASLVFGVTKRALSRALVVMVSLGYSVVKPSLGEQLPKVAAIGFAYFFLAMTYDLMVQLPPSNKMVAAPAYVDSMTVLVMLLACADVVVYTWTLQALMSTIRYLERKKESIKLLLFLRFRAVLVVSVAFSSAWSIYTIAASADGYFEDHWASEWSVNAVWEVLYMLILVAIAVLWMPSQNATRYAYSMQLRTFEGDEEEDEEDNDDIGHLRCAISGDGTIDGEYGGSLEDGEGALPSFSEAITGTKEATGGEKLT